MDPKPGYTTTEFWSTLFVHLITIVVMVAAASGNNAFDGSALQPLIPVAAMVASGIAQAYYSHSRGHTKVASLNAAAQVVSTRVMAENAGVGDIEPTFDLNGDPTKGPVD